MLAVISIVVVISFIYFAFIVYYIDTAVIKVFFSLSFFFLFLFFFFFNQIIPIRWLLLSFVSQLCLEPGCNSLPLMSTSKNQLMRFVF